MKKLITTLTIAVLAALPVIAEEQAGPRGGRLLSLEGQKAEFFVEPDRTVTVSFYDDALKPTAPAGQVVTATAEAPSGKTKLAFEPKGELFASKTPLPEGDGYNVVLQIRTTAEAKPKNFRITYDMHECGGCKRPEYACTCNH
jgi:hypothetical protein